MRVLFSLTYFVPYNSGLTNYVKTLADELASLADYRIKLLCIRHEKSLLKKENISGYKVIRANPLLKISKGFISLDWIIKSIFETLKTDVLVINLPQFEGLFTAFFARLFGKKVVAIYHARVLLRGGWVDYIIQTLLEFSNYFTMLLSHKIVAYTEDYAFNNQELKKFIKKSVCIYPPIRIPKSDKATDAEIRKKIPKQVKLVVGMAARLAEDKGFEYAIGSLKWLENYFGKNRVIVLVAGSLNPVGEKSYRYKIQGMLAEVKDKFVFLGEIPNENIGSFYKHIDVLIVPSILESFGIVQVEAMMCGVPVVTSNLPGARVPIKTTGVGYLVPSKNPEALANGIIKAIKLKAMAKKLTRFVRETFSLDKTRVGFQQLFEKL